VREPYLDPIRKAIWKEDFPILISWFEGLAPVLGHNYRVPYFAADFGRLVSGRLLLLALLPLLQLDPAAD
jgi:hypothetical protein